MLGQQTNADEALWQVEKELELVDKTVEKISFQHVYSQSLTRVGRLAEPPVQQYSGPPPPAPFQTLSLTRAGRLAARSADNLLVSRLEPLEQDSSSAPLR